MLRRGGGGLDDLDDLAFGSVAARWIFAELGDCATEQT
jgi:hypothetical protein